MVYWIITMAVAAILIGVYIWMYLYTRKRQRTFDAQYTAAKERHEVFVLNKRIIKERPTSRWMKYAKFKTYQVTGRVAVSQSVRGMHMSKMQQMTFQTTREEYEKIQTNHRYKMDIAGNYIGHVLAPAPVKEKKPASSRNWLKFGSRKAPEQPVKHKAKGSKSSK